MMHNEGCFANDIAIKTLYSVGAFLSSLLPLKNVKVSVRLRLYFQDSGKYFSGEEMSGNVNQSSSALTERNTFNILRLTFNE